MRMLKREEKARVEREKRLCSIEGCGRPHLAKGFCVVHYTRQRTTGSPLEVLRSGRRKRDKSSYKTCLVDGCDGVARTQGLCPAHYQRKLKYGDPSIGGTLRRRTWPMECTVDGCGAPTIALGLCAKHYGRNARHGDPNKLSDWYMKRFEKFVNEHGYVEVWEPDHPNANADGRVYEHRKVMSDRIGRALLPSETVHHRNGIKTDNDLNNLELWSSNHPKGQRIQDLVEWAHEILRLYPPRLLAQLELPFISQTQTTEKYTT